MNPGKSLREMELSSTPGNIRRKLRRETAFTPGTPPKPPNLMGLEEPIWDEVVETLRAKKILAATDGLILRRYVALRARWFSDLTVLREGGTSWVDLDGIRHVNPLAKVVLEEERTLLALEKELGLTPGKRAAVEPPVPRGRSFAEFTQSGEEQDDSERPN